MKQTLLSLLLLLIMNTTLSQENTAIRASFLHFTADPSTTKNAYEYIEDGLLIIEKGHVKQLGHFSDIKAKINPKNITDYSGKLILPGFIDTHVHYPQTEMIGSHGEELLQWLNTYTFPTETKFKDKGYAKRVARFFLDQLLSNGTTTALVFATVHKESVDAFFEEASERRLRMISGKVMMDRNAPKALLDTPQSSYNDSKNLIEKWHKKERLLYAVTPRFAPTSSEAQLQKAHQLLQEYDDVYLHTHLSENQSELDWVRALYPNASNYLDVYSQAALLRKRSVFAHGIHLSDTEWQALQQHDCSVAFCPTSNLFLGSGLFNLSKAEQYQVRVGLGTDVGAGTSFSMLHTLNEAYKTIQLQKAYTDKPGSIKPLNPLKAFYLATLGGAQALHLDQYIGNFEAGKEADFVVLDLESTNLLKFRLQHCKTLEEKLFALQMLGDDRCVYQTYILGQAVLKK